MDTSRVREAAVKSCTWMRIPSAGFPALISRTCVVSSPIAADANDDRQCVANFGRLVHIYWHSCHWEIVG
jgi:hypothetical protein